MADYSTTLLVDGFAHGEGPRWYDGHLWFTDGMAGAVNVVEDGQIRRVADVPHASGLGWLADDTMVVSASLEAAITQIGATSTVRHELGHLAWSTNDMVAFDDRVYVDLYRFTDAGMVGSIALVMSEGEARVVADELALPNGLVVTPDGSTLLASESDGERVLAFTIDDDGGLLDKRVFAALPGRKPDGLCLDAEGALWGGCYDTGEFLRVRDGGEERCSTGSLCRRAGPSPRRSVAPTGGPGTW